MVELPYRPEHVADAMADASHLTNEELGALVRLKWAFWRVSNGILPLAQLPRYARAGKRWGKIGPAILGMLSVIGETVSDPATNMLKDLTRQRRVKAAAAAAARWAVEKGLDNRAPSHGSGGATSASSEGSLKPYNPLKSLDPGDARASSEQLLGACNQNQNHTDTDSSIASSWSAAKGAFEEGRKRRLDSAMCATLYGPGVDLLVARVGLTRKAANKQITKWAVALDSDGEALGSMLGHADQREIAGPAFIAIIDSAVQRLVVERERGFSLPFPQELPGVEPLRPRGQQQAEDVTERRAARSTSKSTE